MDRQHDSLISGVDLWSRTSNELYFFLGHTWLAKTNFGCFKLPENKHKWPTKESFIYLSLSKWFASREPFLTPK